MSKATSLAPSSKSPTRSNTASRSATTLSDRPIAARWRAVRDAGRAALIPYLTAGFPTAAGSLEALQRVAAAGADLIEVGVPFSDPLADGPTIQHASEVALAQGVTLPGVPDLVRRAPLPLPVVLMTYGNPVPPVGPARLS